MRTATDGLGDIEVGLEPAAPPSEGRLTAGLHRTVIEPKPGWQLVDLGELWRYRELLFFLTLRDIKVRYKQTVLGAAWALLQPLATMLVFSLFFRRAAADPSSPVPYSLFVLAGLVPWMFFSNAIATAGQSVVGSQNLVTKIYFPRLLIPMGAVGARAGRPRDLARHARGHDALVRRRPRRLVRPGPARDCWAWWSPRWAWGRCCRP